MENFSFAATYSRNGVTLRRFTVPAAQQVLHGVYFNGAPYLPDIESVKEKMPKTLHKAIDRGLGFWTDKHSDLVSMDLYGFTRGLYGRAKPLGTIHATANWKAAACRLEGYTHGHLYGCAVKIRERAYKVASDCGAVSITVPAAVASSRIAQASEARAIPVFFYE